MNFPNNKDLDSIQFYVTTKYELNNELLIFWNFGVNKTQLINFILKLSIIFMLFQLLLTSYIVPKSQDTARSFVRNSKVNFLENPYNCDITHLINFHLFKKKLKKNKLDFIKLTSQREFLINMGIKERAEIISKNLPFSSKVDVYLRIKRLIDRNQMGSLFKVLLATKKINNFSLGF